MKQRVKIALGSIAGITLIAGVAFAADELGAKQNKSLSTEKACNCENKAMSTSSQDSLFQRFGLNDLTAEMETMQQDIDKLIRKSLSRFHSGDLGQSISEDFSVPSVNLQDDGTKYIVTADVPGAEETKLSAKLEGKLLTLTGQRTQDLEKKDDKGKLILQERSSGEFQRTLTLPDKVDSSKLSTSYKDGVFTVTVPKA